jgi:membrane-bound lytic murein transglycosylase B
LKIIFFVNCIFITSVLFQSNSAISVEKENIENYKIIIEEISSTLVKKYNVDPKYISKALDSIKIRKKTIESMNNAAERKATWERYRSIFIKKKHYKKR